MKAILKKYSKKSGKGARKASRLIMRAEKRLSRALDDEALRDLAREERRVNGSFQRRIERRAGGVIFVSKSRLRRLRARSSPMPSG